MLDTRGSQCGTFGKSADKLIEELLCADLKVERIAAVLDAYVQEGESKQGNIGVAVIDKLHNGEGGFSW